MLFVRQFCFIIKSVHPNGRFLNAKRGETKMISGIPGLFPAMLSIVVLVYVLTGPLPRRVSVHRSSVFFPITPGKEWRKSASLPCGNLISGHSKGSLFDAIHPAAERRGAVFLNAAPLKRHVIRLTGLFPHLAVHISRRKTAQTLLWFAPVIGLKIPQDALKRTKP